MFTTTRKILDFLFILIFISIVIYTSSFTLNCLYLFTLTYLCSFCTIIWNLTNCSNIGNIETTTKFSRLKSISSIEDNYSFTLEKFICFPAPCYNYKVFKSIYKYFSYLKVFKSIFNLYLFSAFSLQLWRKSTIFMVKKMSIQITLCNLMTYVFKGHIKIIKIYMVKFIVSI